MVVDAGGDVVAVPALFPPPSSLPLHAAPAMSTSTTVQIVM